ncbi:hemerythrin domain-containing protein [Streptomyces sp. NBC_00536]|uniref:hemerythrin domain-containing protein n=1 Tax=Streptomyces sp. NBC_00536 TaxID=2975769 RepID=UPI002E808309|nr:hemerythrin domain-containing protein [Streptomyces sp. NBC_00536]WUC83174.1 hemerythrin domain-containing protein [Streptomyces sp. NBC_00536]
MSDAIDLTVMYAMHGALRRELAQLDRVTTAADRDPVRVLATAAGWTLFKQALRAHHAAEDGALWPSLRQNLAGSPKDLALLEVMEAEHAAIAPVIQAIDELLTEPGADPLRLGQLTDALTRGLAGHLKHEEDTAFPLMRRTLTAEQWAHFSQVHAQHIGKDAPLLLPWLLDGADKPTMTRLLAQLPAPAYAACTARWIPAYTAFDRWSPGTTA